MSLRDEFDISLSVLLVDDDFHTRDILSTYLGELGVSDVHQKASGTEALKFFEENKDWRGLILCDWNMPKMSGAAFYRELRKLKQHQPFIMISGRSDEDSILFAKDNGISTYLVKPILLEELEKKIRKVISSNAAFFKTDVLESLQA